MPASQSPFTEMEEMELAAELLGTTDELELDRVVGRVLRKGAAAVGRPLPRPAGTMLGGILGEAIRRALPSLDVRATARPAVAASGSLAARSLNGTGRALGLELEGLSQEDQEFEAARQLVRLSGAAASAAAAPAAGRPPEAVAKDAVVRAARRYAPGWIGTALHPQPNGCSCHQSAGRWERRGPDIVLHGL